MVPSPRTKATRAYCAVAVVMLLLIWLPAGVATAQSGGGDEPYALSQSQVDADAVLLTIDIQPDGSAGWRVEYRVRLDDENTTDAFEDLQAAVEANESAYVSRFESRMAATVEDAAAATGREMTLRSVSVSTTTEQLPQSYGVLVYTFEWTHFATVEGDRLRVGDALNGLFLDADSALLLSWPDGYTVIDVSPTPTEQRDRSVVWRGPVDFGPSEPELVVSKATGSGGVSASPLGIVVVAIVLIGGGALGWWRIRSGRGATEAAARSGAAGSRPPDELLSNEERVLALLKERGGRLKQQDIVEAFDWTEAKTSGVVKEMRESGQIEGFRLGRENVLQLPAEDESQPQEPGA